jgi:short-subunit dehydrogenase
MQKIVIVGATSSIAQRCARLWVSGATSVHLVGRDSARLDVVAADLRVRGPQAHIVTETVDFESAAAIEELVVRLDNAVDGVDLVLVAHGSLPNQMECEADLRQMEAAIHLNALSPVMFAEAFSKRMDARNRGTLAVIGSVAGDRGRQSNYVYGAAKGLVSTYLEGLQHRFAGRGIRIVLIKPGPTETPMTAHLKGGKMSLARVDDVATTIVKGVERGALEIYAPGKWRWIMMIIRHLPRFVFNKMRI